MRVQTKRGEQWDHCERCGFRKPMSSLTYQKGLRVCTQTCVDNLEIERHAVEVGKILERGETEGSDLRYVDQAFFNNLEEVTQ